MALINIETPKRALKKPKRMLELTETDEEIKIAINYSSLSVIHKCMKMAHLKLGRKLTHETEAPALTTGRGVHKAMEIWYGADASERRPSTYKSSADIQRLIMREAFDISESDLRVKAIKAYLDEMEPLLDGQDLGARAPGNVANVLDKYFDYYLNDDYIIFHDDKGPFIEREFEMPLIDGDKSFSQLSGKKLKVTFHGAIDMMFVSKSNPDALYVVDHKTTSSLGKQFFQRIKPNHQYAGYFLAGMEHFKLPVTHFLVNGIQIAKTKCEFKRQPTVIEPWELQEVKVALTSGAINYYFAEQTKVFPKSAPDSCSMWGACEYINLCSVNEDLATQIMNNQYRSASNEAK